MEASWANLCGVWHTASRRPTVLAWPWHQWGCGSSKITFSEKSPVLELSKFDCCNCCLRRLRQAIFNLLRVLVCILQLIDYFDLSSHSKLLWLDGKADVVDRLAHPVLWVLLPRVEGRSRAGRRGWSIIFICVSVLIFHAYLFCSIND